jgi:hypothetical protein
MHYFYFANPCATFVAHPNQFNSELMWIWSGSFPAAFPILGPDFILPLDLDSTVMDPKLVFCIRIGLGADPLPQRGSRSASGSGSALFHHTGS